jgi:hypothetical protein
MKTFRAVAGLAATAVILLAAGCQSSSSGAGATPVRTVTKTAKASPPKTHHHSQPHSTTAGKKTWTMPSEIGKNLQAAQDDIQAVTGDGIFYTGSTDATGQGRTQIFDRDWQVCSQNVSAGSTITAKSKISFAVVRVSVEHCP